MGTLSVIVGIPTTDYCTVIGWFSFVIAGDSYRLRREFFAVRIVLTGLGLQIEYNCLCRLHGSCMVQVVHVLVRAQQRDVVSTAK